MMSATATPGAARERHLLTLLGALAARLWQLLLNHRLTPHRPTGKARRVAAKKRSTTPAEHVIPSSPATTAWDQACPALWAAKPAAKPALRIRNR